MTTTTTTSSKHNHDLQVFFTKIKEEAQRHGIQVSFYSSNNADLLASKLADLLLCMRGVHITLKVDNVIPSAQIQTIAPENARTLALLKKFLEVCYTTASDSECKVRLFIRDPDKARLHTVASLADAQLDLKQLRDEFEFSKTLSAPARRNSVEVIFFKDL
jgi:hypothetical protein